MKYILALDQGTTSSRALVFDNENRLVSMAQQEFTQIYPTPGQVEHNPMEIWESQLFSAKEALAKARITGKDIHAIGITNQRETFIVWDKLTGKPIHNAIVWQCRRSAAICDELKAKGYEQAIRNKTGLTLDPYFSGPKLKWLLDLYKYNDNLLFGTVDTWIIWQLTNGEYHITDHTNASRTMLYNIHSLEWDLEILEILGIPIQMLPKVVPSSGYIAETTVFGGNIPIMGIAGDQQAALFGQGCFEAGMAKNTYGTGCFLLMNTGSKPMQSNHGLITTMAASYENNIQYVLEGSIFIGGAVIQWLRDEMGLIKTASETDEIALSVPDTAGVVIVPAFVGLGAPHWDAYARGIITGLTRGSKRAHIIRAALESMAYQTFDIMECMALDSNIRLTSLQVDGGASKNDFLMQFQADILNTPVHRPAQTETTAMGAAWLAGLASGYWGGINDLKASEVNVFVPKMLKQKREEFILNWKDALAQALKSTGVRSLV